MSEEKFISLVCIPSRAKVSVKSKNVIRIYNLLEKIYSYKEEAIENPNEYCDSFFFEKSVLKLSQNGILQH